jgi:formate dehydrogenase iron-sulfur subunit
VTLLTAVAAVEETPVDRFLAEQADLTAVERFAQRHESAVLPAQARYYRDLVPLTVPGPGQQYGFEVDLDACTGCKSCVAACHSLNGLDDGESWRSVTTVTGTVAGGPFQQTVTSACHHCVDPACMHGCPVDAYEKNPVTGIVVHLDDQCIGCSYCTLTCPYEVPVLNHARGIVRKCDMCRGRLAEGEAPACVQACPNQAIAVRVVDTSALVGSSTVYRSESGRMAALDATAPARPGPALAHPPLAAMLVLTQLSVGAFVIDMAMGRVGPMHLAVALGAGVLALAASTLHLGRPQYAYRAVIGLRHSWLSREVVAFGAFTGLAFLHAVGVLRTAVGWSAASVGVFGVACSVLIYTSTHRAAWRPAVVTAKFAVTTLMLGATAAVWASAVGGVTTPMWLSALVAALTAAKLSAEASGVRRLHPDLRRRATARFACGVAALALIPVAVAVSLVWTLVLAGLLVGEYLERWLFFTTASPPR